MKRLMLGLSYPLLLFFTFNVWGSAPPIFGQDNRVEWRLQQRWTITGQTLDMVHSLDGKFVYILNDRQQVHVFNNEGELQGTIPVDAGVSKIDIAPQGERLYLVNDKDHSFVSMNVFFTVTDINIQGSPFKGPVDAPITMVVFSDFE